MAENIVMYGWHLQNFDFDEVIHVSHDDTDGESPILLTKLAFADKNLRIKSCGYDKVDDVVKEFLPLMTKKTLMMITDINVATEVAASIHECVENGYKIFVIDHHDSKPEVPLEKYDWMHIEMVNEKGVNTAATSMYYDFLLMQGFLQRSDVLDDYVELVRSFDTWDWKREDNIRAKRLNDFFFMSSRTEFADAVFPRISDKTAGAQFKFEPHIEYMLDKEQIRIDEYIKKKKKQMKVLTSLVDDDVRMYTYGVMFAETYQSELGNHLCDTMPELDFVIMIDPGSKKMSLRSSKENVNVGQIAHYFGGGGRKATAGCPLNELTKTAFVEELLIV